MRRAYFILTIFLSSGLLFLVEPLVARMILPGFGGSPAVWTASMVFFQGFLLLGYAYAHLSSKWLGPRRQPIVHVVIMLAALATLPFAMPKDRGAIGTANPTLPLLLTLTAMVGGAFFCLSAGAPLIQRWFSNTDDKDANDPYFLYSASNLASLIALLAYPLLIEPRLRLGEQSTMWAIGYGVLILMTGVCALSALKAHKASPESAPAAEVIPLKSKLLWVALAAVPSSLLLGATSFLTTNIAPIPLLWVVPLSIYLLTFILAFAKRRFFGSKELGRVMPLLALPLALMIILESDRPIEPIAGFHLVTFFVVAWMCHARLHETRPGAGALTEFYVWISVGGVLGGMFNSILAPLVFKSLAEYPVALIAAMMLRPAISNKSGKLEYIYPVLVGAAGMIGVFTARRMGMPPDATRTMATLGVPLILCMFAMDRPVRFGLSVGAVFLVANITQITSDVPVVFNDRSFFGVHRVSQTADHRYFRLMHGNTLHGMQDRQNPRLPLTYYHPTGPIGHVFKAFSGDFKKDHVALVGMGVGSLAAYGEPGQRMTFFEIDPVVERIATDPNFFTFLRDSRAKVDIVMGDARLTLAQQPSGEFGMIVLDAFSSDAIPIHLLTREAFQMYLDKLEPGGIIAVHISNRYLELEPVLSALAKDLRLQSKSFMDGILEEEKRAGKTESNWVVIARKEADFGGLQQDNNWGETESWEGQRVWTDDYSNVLGVFRTDQ